MLDATPANSGTAQSGLAIRLDSSVQNDFGDIESVLT
jgi:hypothetical protein